jgi:hypothetical protein
METRNVLLVAAALAATFALTACNRDAGTPPKPQTDATPAPRDAGAVGGPGATQGGLTGEPAGGTPGGAATASTPQGMPPGAGTEKTDQGGLASRPTEGPQRDAEPRPNVPQK